MSESKPTKQTALSQRFRGYLPVVIDVECGGFNAGTDAILEIAAVILGMDDKLMLGPEETHFYRVVPFPGANLEEAALKFTGIDPHHPLRIAHPEDEVMKDMFRHIRKKMKAEHCKRAILVGHNAHFDHGFVRAAAERHAIKRNPFHPFSSLDTVSLSALSYGQTVLSRACEAAGIEFDQNEAHSARYDAEKTAELFCNIINSWKILGGWPNDN
ncbi:MAG: ribonuclease T [Pseudohongiellaceae bacterium]